jgi:hypothetical protein
MMRLSPDWRLGQKYIHQAIPEVEMLRTSAHNQGLIEHCENLSVTRRRARREEWKLRLFGDVLIHKSQGSL